MMGYEPSYLPENRHPTIEELDQAAPYNPLHCMHGGGHICMYNSLALQQLGVYEAEDAKKYPKNEVEVVDGKLTGMVRGHTHFLLWSKVHYSNKAQIEAAKSPFSIVWKTVLPPSMTVESWEDPLIISCKNFAETGTFASDPT